MQPQRVKSTAGKQRVREVVVGPPNDYIGFGDGYVFVWESKLLNCLTGQTFRQRQKAVTPPLVLAHLPIISILIVPVF